MFPTLSLGPLVLPTAGLVYILGAWVALSLVERSARRLAIDSEAAYTLCAVVLAAGFVGARLVFVALHWPAYQDNLPGIVWPLTSGFNVWGGLLFGLTAGFFYGRARRLAWAATLDAVAPGLLLALMAVSLADFLAGPGYGKPASVPWAISLFGIRRHAVQLYEIGVGLAALLLWWWLAGRRSFAGQLFLVATAVYSGGRLFVDAYRANAWLTSTGFHMLQIICLAVLLASVFLLARQGPIGQEVNRE
ncbi:MAG: prolipoprotein diacylglyceryl transferase [Chloroflexi bacterium]|nr:prolipoprotein diacylglyceryl transferase [Chloroflexota bacterium]MCI0577550.1 prolipoprotein diacylglyceryl transferase [Chloroflexota bacterium]MCI0645611.1 prolipoprotein diacylglyceryl transferase [Chloroflexota bacterium]MCI0725523.1 prolipoprotein diacylglyceryl transferase [Chloroflexota bacterium]